MNKTSDKKSNSLKLLLTTTLSIIIIIVLIINININNNKNENNQDINNRELLSFNLEYLSCYTEQKWIESGLLNETYVKCNESYTLTSCSSFHGYTSFRYGTYSNGSICYTKDLGTSLDYSIGLEARCCKINNILGYSYPLSVNYTRITKNMTTNSDKCLSLYCPNNQTAIGSAIQMGYIDENENRQVLTGYNGNDYINNSYNNNTIGLQVYANDSNINHQIGLGLFCSYNNKLKCFVQYSQYDDNGNAVASCPSGYVMTSCDVKIRNNGPCNNVSQINTVGGTLYFDNLCYAYGYDSNYNPLVAVAVCCQVA